MSKTLLEGLVLKIFRSSLKMKYHKMKHILLFIWLCSVMGGGSPAIGLGESSLLGNGRASALNEAVPTITSLTPTQAFNSGIIQYTIQGEGFTDKLGVKLVQNKLEISGFYTKVEAGSRIQCFFDLSGKPFGDYDLVLTTPSGGEAIFKRAFQIRIFVLVYEINSLMKPIFFDYNQFKIREDQVYMLQGNINLLLANPYYYILLEGYTDPQGSREYNLGLSVNRVESVRRILVEAGIPESRVFTCHYLQESSLLTRNVNTNWDTARRVDISLSETPPYKGD